MWLEELEGMPLLISGCSVLQTAALLSDLTHQSMYYHEHCTGHEWIYNGTRVWGHTWFLCAKTCLHADATYMHLLTIIIIVEYGACKYLM